MCGDRKAALSYFALLKLLSSFVRERESERESKGSNLCQLHLCKVMIRDWSSLRISYHAILAS